MNNGLIWIGGIAGLIVAAALIEAYVKRNRKRNLADMRPDPDDISKIAGIDRHGLDPVTLAQAEHRRLEEEGWVPGSSENGTSAAENGEKEEQNDRC